MTYLTDIICKKWDLTFAEEQILKREAEKSWAKVQQWKREDALKFLVRYGGLNSSVFVGASEKVEALKAHGYAGLKGHGKFEDMDLSQTNVVVAVSQVYNRIVGEYREKVLNSEIEPLF